MKSYASEHIFFHSQNDDFMKARIILLLTLLIVFVSSFTVDMKAADRNVYEVTASRLNIRQTPSTGSAIIGSLPKGTKVEGEVYNAGWIRIYKDGRYGYISSEYVKYVQAQKASKPKKSFWKSLEFGPLGTFVLLFFGIPFLLGFLKGIFELILDLLKDGLGLVFDVIGAYGILYILFFLAFLPFRILNRLQIVMHKPWRVFQRHSWPSEDIKPFLRFMNIALMVPLYIILTPLRFVNAVAFNLILRPLFEFWNYICEVFAPSTDAEGASGFWKWLLYLPVRILKYPVGHGLLTLTECLIFTVADTIFPAVTLYHGTSGAAADTIVISPTRTAEHNSRCRWTDGIWNVGKGNYAGDGIYFAPRAKTSVHYARSCVEPVLIICRVSLGRILPLSLAPDYVFSAAGHPDAHTVTRYGLDNGYVSIEWWRSDCKWWEYCLLDWQNKYNESWRIRPVTVMNINSYFFKRIAGGARHWLFDKDIVKDICTTLRP